MLEVLGLNQVRNYCFFKRVHMLIEFTKLLLALRNSFSPGSSPLQFSFFQRALAACNEETPRRRYEIAALFFQIVGDASGGIPKHLDEFRRDSGVERSYVDTLKLEDFLEEVLNCRRRPARMGRRARSNFVRPPFQLHNYANC